MADALNIGEVMDELIHWAHQTELAIAQRDAALAECAWGQLQDLIATMEALEPRPQTNTETVKRMAEEIEPAYRYFMNSHALK